MLVWAHAELAELEKSSKPKHETPRALSLPTLLVVPPDVPSRMSEMERKPLAWADQRWQASGEGRFGESCVSFKQLAPTYVPPSASFGRPSWRPDGSFSVLCGKGRQVAEKG